MEKTTEQLAADVWHARQRAETLRSSVEDLTRRLREADTELIDAQKALSKRMYELVERAGSAATAPAAT